MAKKTKKEAVADSPAALMERYGVDVLYENAKGEFFIDENLALNSEHGKVDKVKTHNKE